MDNGKPVERSMNDNTGFPAHPFAYIGGNFVNNDNRTDLEKKIDDESLDTIHWHD